MRTPMTIGQRDLEFYKSCVDQHTRDLRECMANEEQGHRIKLRLALAVCDALRAYNEQVHS